MATQVSNETTHKADFLMFDPAFNAELLYERADEGIEHRGEHRHTAHKVHRVALVDIHRDFDKERQARLEEGQAPPNT